MSDDIVKDILGFDPTTGGRDEDRGNLQPVAKQETDEHGNLIPPLGIQEEFEHFVHATYSNPEVPFRQIKEALFLATTNRNEVTRSFFAYNPTETDFLKKFKEQTKAVFLKDEAGKYVPSRLTYLGEDPEGNEKIVIDFHARPDSDTVTLIAGIQNRKLTAWFDEGTQLAQLSFSYSIDGEDSAPFNINKNTTYEAANRGKLEIGVGDDTYEITHDRKNNGPIDITRINNGEKLDHLAIPWHLTNIQDQRIIRLAEVASKFFGGYEFTDPFTQPPYSDIDDFAGLDPIETLGITWTRGSEENTTLQSQQE